MLHNVITIVYAFHSPAKTCTDVFEDACTVGYNMKCDLVRIQPFCILVVLFYPIWVVYMSLRVRCIIAFQRHIHNFK